MLRNMCRCILQQSHGSMQQQTKMVYRLMCSQATTSVELHVEKEDLGSYYKELNKSLSSKSLAKVQDVVESRLHHPAASTLADLVQFSPDLQRLVALGVSFTEVEKYEGAPDLLASLSYFPQINDMVNLLHSMGIEDVASVINRCPFILGQHVETIKERVLYLSAKKFKRNQISEIVCRCPWWLLEEISEIDARLGAIQVVFELKAKDLRTMTTKSPRVILSDIIRLKEFAFTMRKVYSLEPKQLSRMVTNAPSVSITSRTSLKRRLDFLLDTMEISMEQIIAWPSVLRNRERRIEERHKLLKHLGLAEYDATKAGYVSLQRLVSGKTDVFCSEVAHISEQQYFDFIKTL